VSQSKNQKFALKPDYSYPVKRHSLLGLTPGWKKRGEEPLNLNVKVREEFRENEYCVADLRTDRKSRESED